MGSLDGLINGSIPSAQQITGAVSGSVPSIPSAGALGSLIPSASGALGAIGNVLDPSKARLAIAGLFSGGASTKPKQQPVVNFAGGAAVTGFNTDWRVKIKLPQSSDLISDNDGFMSLLSDTNGVIFPYTPQVTVNYVANYTEQQLTHSNYPAYFYNNSAVQNIQITGDFTVQNVTEGQYLLAAIYFFRTCTKMFFGVDENAGTPPPIVYLDGYGTFYFPNVPCVITQFSHTMPQDVDYVEVPVASSSSQLLPTRLPTQSQITLSLQPVVSRAQSQLMGITEFSSGALISDGTTPGFL